LISTELLADQATSSSVDIMIVDINHSVLFILATRPQTMHTLLVALWP